MKERFETGFGFRSGAGVAGVAGVDGIDGKDGPGGAVASGAGEDSAPAESEGIRRGTFAFTVRPFAGFSGFAGFGSSDIASTSTLRISCQASPPHSVPYSVPSG